MMDRPNLAPLIRRGFFSCERLLRRVNFGRNGSRASVRRPIWYFSCLAFDPWHTHGSEWVVRPAGARLAPPAGRSRPRGRAGFLVLSCRIFENQRLGSTFSQWQAADA